VLAGAVLVETLVVPLDEDLPKDACGVSAVADLALHDTYIVWNWALASIPPLVVMVLVLGAAALIKYLFWR
jgi:hypothetical protein